MLFGEFLGGTLEVSTGFLDVVLELLVIAVELLVEIEVGVLDLRVLLPGIGLRSLYADLKTVVLDDAGEGLGQTSLLDEGLYGLFYLRAKGFDGFFTLVSAQYSCKHLVDDFIINCFHNTNSFVLGLGCEWPLSARASHTILSRG